jgi:toxin YoeB
MGKFRIEITKEAEKDIAKHYKSGNKSNISKLDKIFEELTLNPYEGTGNPEKLKHEYSGYWSRKINLKDRLIYRVNDIVVTVFIVSAIGHYSDK